MNFPEPVDLLLPRLRRGFNGRLPSAMQGELVVECCDTCLARQHAGWAGRFAPAIVLGKNEPCGDNLTGTAPATRDYAVALRLLVSWHHTLDSLAQFQAQSGIPQTTTIDDLYHQSPRVEGFGPLAPRWHRAARLGK
jgi:hypothetical protein